MGLAASQCRILSLTSRMSDLELRSQMLSNQKVALATASSQASNRYIKALNGEHLGLYTPSGEYTDATANLLTRRDAMTGTDQLFLQDDLGQVLCSDDVLRAFNASNGNLENFLNHFGCTANTDDTKSLKNISKLLSGGLTTISDSSENLRLVNLLNDENSGVNLKSIGDDYKRAQMTLDSMYKEHYDDKGNLTSVSYMPLTEGAPDSYKNSVRNIANTLLAASCGIETDANGNYVVDPNTGLYKIAPKRNDDGNIIYNYNTVDGAYQDVNGLWTSPNVPSDMTAEEYSDYLSQYVPNVLNETIYDYAMRACNIVTDEQLNTNRYYYTNDGITSSVLKSLNISQAQANDTSKFNTNAADLFSNAQASDIYKFTQATSTVLYNYYKERGLSEEELSEIINATDVASVACVTQILNTSQDYKVPGWFTGNYGTSNEEYLNSVTIDKNSANKSITASAFEGKTVYNDDYGSHTSPYADMIEQYMAYFDAVISDGVNVKSSITSGAAVSGSGDFSYGKFLYISDMTQSKPVSRTYTITNYYLNNGALARTDTSGTTPNKAYETASLASTSATYQSGYYVTKAGYSSLESHAVRHNAEHSSGWSGPFYRWYYYRAEYYSTAYYYAYHAPQEAPLYAQTKTYNVYKNTANSVIGESASIPYLSTSIMNEFNTYLDEQVNTSQTERISELQSQLETYEMNTSSVSAPETHSRNVDTVTVSDLLSQGITNGEFIQKPVVNDSGEVLTYDKLGRNGEPLFELTDDVEWSDSVEDSEGNTGVIPTWDEYYDDGGNLFYTYNTEGTGTVLKRQKRDADGNLMFDIDEPKYNEDKSAAKVESDSAAATASAAKQVAQSAAATAQNAANNAASKTALRETAQNNLAAAQAEQQAANADLAAAQAEQQDANSDAQSKQESLASAQSTLDADKAAQTEANSDLASKNTALGFAETELNSAKAEQTAANENLSLKVAARSTASNALASAKSAKLAADDAVTSARAYLDSLDPNENPEEYAAAQESLEAAELQAQQAEEAQEAAQAAYDAADDEVSAANTRCIAANSAVETAQDKYDAAYSAAQAAQAVSDNADATVATSQAAYDTALANSNAANARFTAANTWVSNATTRVANAISAVTSATSALTSAQEAEAAAITASNAAQAEYNTVNADYLEKQGIADQKFAYYDSINPEQYRYLEHWEYPLMSIIQEICMDDYYHYTYTDENGNLKTVDLKADLNPDDPGNTVIHDFPEIYQTAKLNFALSTVPEEYELNDETAQSLKMQLMATGKYQDLDFINEVNGNYQSKTPLEILQMYSDYKNSLEQEYYDAVEAQNARIAASITEISSVTTFSASQKGFEDYSKKFAGIYKGELEEALNGLKYDGLSSYVNGVLETKKTSLATLRSQLYNIEETVKNFLKDAGNFFDTEYPYTKAIADEVQAIKNMANKKSFTNDELIEIKDHISNISKLAGIPDTVEVKYTDESSIAYYTNLFEALKNSSKNGKSPVGIDSDSWNDSQWLQEQLKIGNIHVSATENGELVKKQYSTAFTYLSVDTLSDAELTKAQAEYEKEISRISKKEKKIDNELKMIETEHTALEQQVESIKTSKDENISRNFQLFS